MDKSKSTFTMDKLTEKIYLDSFLKTYYKNTNFTYFEEDEKPDFIIEVEGKKIGVEVTELLISDKMKQHESTVSIICKKTQEKLQANLTDKYLQVSPGFKRLPSINRLNRESFSDKLVEAVLNNLPNEDSAMITLRNTYENDDVIPDELNYMHIITSPTMTKHFVKEVDGGYFEEDLLNKFQNILNKKEKKLSRYVKRYDDIWLLITAQGFNASSLVDPSDESILHTYKSSFDKAFYFQLFDKSFFELKLDK